LEFRIGILKKKKITQVLIGKSLGLRAMPSPDEGGDLIKAKPRPSLRGFSKFQIEKFERELERFKDDCRKAGLSRNFLNLNSERISFLTLNQIDFIKGDTQSTELDEAGVIEYFNYVKRNETVRYVDVLALLSDAKIMYMDSVMESYGKFLIFIKEKLWKSNVDPEEVSPNTNDGRIMLFKVLRSKLSKANAEEFKHWMRRTKSISDPTKKLLKNPDYKICKDKFLTLLKEDFKQLKGKIKQGTLIDYSKKRKNGQRNSRGSKGQGDKQELADGKIAAVKKSKRGTVLKCWKCEKNHSMKDCPEIPEAERIAEFKKELNKRREEWRKNHPQKSE